MRYSFPLLPRAKQIGVLMVLIAISLIALQVQAQESTVTVNRSRAPMLDLAAYEKIAVGDIVGSAGAKTTSSLDMTDALTTELFNANSLEIIDQSALKGILASQSTSGLTAIDESSVAALSEKLSSAIMIVGRIQNEKLYRERKSQQNVVVVNGCNYNHWWELTGDITAQIKIIDIKTGSLLFSKPLTQKIHVETKHECDPYELGDTEPLLKDAIADLGRQVARLVVPYEEEVKVDFALPMLVAIKNPFKQWDEMIYNVQNGDHQAALEILKGYDEDASLKKAQKIMAAYNYGAGLYIAGEYDLAETQLKKALSMGSQPARILLPKIAEEKKAQQELANRSI